VEQVDDSKTYQICTLVLEDGSKAHFTGKYQINTDDPTKIQKVVDIILSTEKHLPKDHVWTILEQ
jgi:hypothetical protein